MEHTKQRIVVKVGTSTLTHDSGSLDLRSMEHLVRTLADLSGMGHRNTFLKSTIDNRQGPVRHGT